MPDSHGIAESALSEFGIGGMQLRQSSRHSTASTLDTIRGARALAAANCVVVLTLGGDGTNRAFALGWRDAPLLPISTGTNNVFPRFVEATVAGAAAGLDRKRRHCAARRRHGRRRRSACRSTANATTSR